MQLPMWILSYFKCVVNYIAVKQKPLHHGISNDRQLAFVFNNLFKLTSNETSKLHITRNPIVSSELPSQRASNDNSVPMPWLPCESFAWWPRQMEIFSALLALCEGNSPVTGEFPSQRSVTWGFHGLFDLRLNKRLSKPARRGWFETPSCSLWRP